MDSPVRNLTCTPWLTCRELGGVRRRGLPRKRWFTEVWGLAQKTSENYDQFSTWKHGGYWASAILTREHWEDDAIPKWEFTPTEGMQGRDFYSLQEYAQDKNRWNRMARTVYKPRAHPELSQPKHGLHGARMSDVTNSLSRALERLGDK
eukprot:13926737-Alexandrium_andersonii.AAC.1